jgi:hypothetical protein
MYRYFLPGSPLPRSGGISALGREPKQNFTYVNMRAPNKSLFKSNKKMLIEEVAKFISVDTLIT